MKKKDLQRSLETTSKNDLAKYLHEVHQQAIQEFIEKGQQKKYIDDIAKEVLSKLLIKADITEAVIQIKALKEELNNLCKGE